MTEVYGCVVSRDSSARTLESDSESGCSECGSKSSGAGPKCLKQPPASDWVLSRRRRALDIVISALVLTLACVPMLLIALAVRLTSPGGAFFTQLRVGRNGSLFRIYKFRTMFSRQTRNRGLGLTRAGDARITAVGQVLRKFKLDELPQFYNVLRGDMSLVGPRPKLPQYEPLRNMPYRPGITGAATLMFSREEDLLKSVPSDRVEHFYETRIKTLKARVDVCAMCRATPLSDLQILAATAGFRGLPPAPLPVQLTQLTPEREYR